MKKLFLAAFVLALFVTGCKKEVHSLTMDFNGLEDLGGDYVYEGWLIVDGNPVSTGIFTVDGAGVMSRTSFEIDEADRENATAFVLSIEPMVDNDPAPSDVKILQGDFSGDVAAVNTGIVGDFSASTGKFILATPTTTATTDDLSGVWFLDAGTAGLSLPALGAGWQYEGWAVINGTPVSTGTFTATDAADASGIYSGTDAPAPPFPGEDFIMAAPAGLTFPTDLTGAPIVVSVEPIPDNSAAPFGLKPLIGSSPASGTMVGTAYNMGNESAGLPTGSVTKISEKE